jgi:hypothetical protein
MEITHTNFKYKIGNERVKRDVPSVFLIGRNTRVRVVFPLVGLLRDYILSECATS